MNINHNIIKLTKENKMLVLAIFMGVILLATNSKSKKQSIKKPDSFEKPVLKTYQGYSSGYDSINQVHWTREDKMEFREL